MIKLILQNYKKLGKKQNQDIIFHPYFLKMLASVNIFYNFEIELNRKAYVYRR